MKFRGNEDYFGMGDSKPTKLKVCRNFKKVSFVRDANVKMIDDFLIVKVALYVSFFYNTSICFRVQFPRSLFETRCPPERIHPEESFFPFIGHDELSISSVQIKFSRDGVSSLRVIKSEFSRAIGEARQGKAGRVMARGRKKGS